LRYASEGDTMGMLVAVLDSNFWLATHVVTITVGYGTTFMAGLFAHAYLWGGARQWPDEKMKNLEGIMVGMVLVSVFFTILGTILGGIWADQSWGRFWGWDPKENGALLIVLWLLMLIHGRKSKWIGAPAYAMLLAICNIVVAVAWFGVNLLNVGLHSYGFTDSIATNLLVFSVGQLLLAVGLYVWAKVVMGKERAERLSILEEEEGEGASAAK
jgi:ABC-type transport system involved in cytochrome c biogenesis permease subunit